MIYIKKDTSKTITNYSTCALSVSASPSELFCPELNKGDDGVGDRSRSLEVSVMDRRGTAVGNYLWRSTLPPFNTGSDKLKFKLRGDK